jgi:acyl-CoA synthetase (AMP-forming)/AMP-acid ligase II
LNGKYHNFVEINNMLQKLKAHAIKTPGKVAVIDKLGRHTYQEIYARQAALSQRLHETLTQNPKRGTEGDPNTRRILQLTDGDSSHVISQFAVWGTQSVTVPVSVKATPNEIEYLIEDSQADLIIS